MYAYPLFNKGHNLVQARHTELALKDNSARKKTKLFVP